MASAELRKINRRIKSVKSTKKITRAMELIASSRIVKAQQRLNTSKNYSRILGEIIRELANSGSLPKPPDYSGKKNVTLVVITSDRGLAGAYNSNILKIKILLVSVLITVALVSILLLIKTGNVHFKHGLEWNYFIGVFLFYLLTRLFWKKA